MILYDLLCDREHQFESWFKNSGAYEILSKAHKVQCPVCGSATVNKAPMAPNLSRSAKKKLQNSDTEQSNQSSGDLGKHSDDKSVAESKALESITKIQKELEKNFENVGTRFPEEARKIHYGETKSRGIYGEASAEDAKELIDEGLEIATIPWHKRRTS